MMLTIFAIFEIKKINNFLKLDIIITYIQTD